MNKIILSTLLIIGLVGMIGTAAANPALMKITPEDIVINPNGIIVTPVEVRVYDYTWTNPTWGDPQDRYISGYSSTSAVQLRLSVDGGSTWTSWTSGSGSSSRVGATYQIGSVPDEKFVKFEVKGTTSATLAFADNHGTSYPIGGISFDDQILYDVAAETPGVDIPEFPTVALPIAAILGLMFIISSRKKKE